MSVIHFGAAELANIVLCASGGRTADDWSRQCIAQHAATAARYSAANAEAYNATYPGENAEAFSANEIVAAIRPLSPKFRDALQLAGLMHYNAVANSGDSAADLATLEGLNSILSALLFEAHQRIPA